MTILLDDWKNWVEMKATKQFLVELAELRANKLESLYRSLLNGRDKEAVIDTGCIKALEDIVTLIYSKKED